MIFLYENDTLGVLLRKTILAVAFWLSDTVTENNTLKTTLKTIKEMTSSRQSTNEKSVQSLEATQQG